MSNSMNNLLKENNEIKCQETKKFVFQIFDENIDLVETMSSEQKSNLVNKLLYNYQAELNREKKKTDIIKLCKKAAIVGSVIIIGIPLLLLLVNLSFDLTLNNYSEMQQNFEKLFKE